jgi:Holliday junction resolvase
LRKRGKIDANQKRIVAQLRDLGYSVKSTANLGDGFPDIIVGANGKNYLFEIKDGDKPPCQRKLTDDEQEFFNLWRGQVNIAESIVDIFEII